MIVFQVQKQITLQHERTLETGLVIWGHTRLAVMPFSGRVVLWGKTSKTDPAMLHIYNGSTTNWKKDKAITGLCEHEENVFVLGVVINKQEYIASSCSTCKRIRLCNMTTGQITTAFDNSLYIPGHMCQGDNEEIYVYAVHDVKGLNIILQLDCSRPQFSLIKTIQSGMVKYYAISYIPTHKFSVVGDNSPGIVRAVSCEMGSIAWELMGQVNGIWCEPLGMIYLPHHDALLASDGWNCRWLVLNAGDGAVRQVIPSPVGAINEMCFYQNEIVMQHNEGKEKISYFSLN